MTGLTDLPTTVGHWTRQPARDGHGRVRGVKYSAVVTTGERVVVAVFGNGESDGWYSLYALYQTPADHPDLDWSGPNGFTDYGDVRGKTAGFDALGNLVEQLSPRDIVGTTQVTFDDVKGDGQVVVE